MRTGGFQYGGGIFEGIIGEELKQGSQRLSDLAGEESAAISAAKTAYETGKWRTFNNQIELLKDTREQKQKELENYNKKISEAEKKVTEQLQNEKLQLNIQKEKQD